MSNQKNLPDTPNATSLPESADGVTPCNSQESGQMSLFGLGVAPVNHLAAQARAREQMTNDTSGLSSPGSSASAALQLAGVGPDVPIWTGSCPCQPFSAAGQGKGTDDERHLWPEFARLIRECKPPVILGEQVASKAGREWFDGVSTDLEDMGYAAAAADLRAAGVGAPHIRQRLFWVANSGREQLSGDARAVCATEAGCDCQGKFDGREHIDTEYGGEVHSGAADARRELQAQRHQQCEAGGEVRVEGGVRGCVVVHGRLGDADHPRPQGHAEHESHGDEPGRNIAGEVRPSGAAGWHNFDLVRCVEPTKEPGRYVEKRRRVESGTLPLAHGIPGRVGLLRGYGNAIVPQVASEFIQAYMEIK